MDTRKCLTTQVAWLEEAKDKQAKQILALEHKIKRLEAITAHLVKGGHPLPYGKYFMLEEKEGSEGTVINIWLGDSSSKADDTCPKAVFDEIDTILRPIFKTKLECGVQEGLCTVEWEEGEIGTMMNLIKEKLEINGWSESYF